MTYAKPEQPVLRTPRRRPTPCPRDTRNVLTRVAADSVREIAIVSGDPLRWNHSTPVPANAEGKPVPHPRSPAIDPVFRAEHCGSSPNPWAYPAAKPRGVGPAAVSPSMPLLPEYGGNRTLQNGRPSQPHPQPANESESRRPGPAHRPHRSPTGVRARGSRRRSTREITHEAAAPPD